MRPRTALVAEDYEIGAIATDLQSIQVANRLYSIIVLIVQIDQVRQFEFNRRLMTIREFFVSDCSQAFKKVTVWDTAVAMQQLDSSVGGLRVGDIILIHQASAKEYCNQIQLSLCRSSRLRLLFRTGTVYSNVRDIQSLIQLGCSVFGTANMLGNDRKALNYLTLEQVRDTMIANIIVRFDSQDTTSQRRLGRKSVVVSDSPNWSIRLHLTGKYAIESFVNSLKFQHEIYSITQVVFKDTSLDGLEGYTTPESDITVAKVEQKEKMMRNTIKTIQTFAQLGSSETIRILQVQWKELYLTQSKVKPVHWETLVCRKTCKYHSLTCVLQDRDGVVATAVVPDPTACQLFGNITASQLIQEPENSSLQVVRLLEALAEPATQLFTAQLDCQNLGQESILTLQGLW